MGVDYFQHSSGRTPGMRKRHCSQKLPLYRRFQSSRCLKLSGGKGRQAGNRSPSRFSTRNWVFSSSCYATSRMHLSSDTSDFDIGCSELSPSDFQKFIKLSALEHEEPSDIENTFEGECLVPA